MHERVLSSEQRNRMCPPLASVGGWQKQISANCCLHPQAIGKNMLLVATDALLIRITLQKHTSFGGLACGLEGLLYHTEQHRGPCVLAHMCCAHAGDWHMVLLAADRCLRLQRSGGIQCHSMAWTSPPMLVPCLGTAWTASQGALLPRTFSCMHFHTFAHPCPKACACTCACMCSK